MVGASFVRSKMGICERSRVEDRIGCVRRRRNFELKSDYRNDGNIGKKKMGQATAHLDITGHLVPE
jgi:hypothetical protein